MGLILHQNQQGKTPWYTTISDKQEQQITVFLQNYTIRWQAGYSSLDKQVAL